MDEQRGYEIAYNRLSRKYRAHVDTMKANNHFYILALESALIETKFQLKCEIERLNMTIAEIESKEMNGTIETKKVSNEVQKFESGDMMFNNVREARELMSSFVGMIKSKDTEQNNMSKALN